MTTTPRTDAASPTIILTRRTPVGAVPWSQGPSRGASSFQGGGGAPSPSSPTVTLKKRSRPPSTPPSMPQPTGPDHPPPPYGSRRARRAPHIAAIGHERPVEAADERRRWRRSEHSGRRRCNGNFQRIAVSPGVQRRPRWSTRPGRHVNDHRRPLGSMAAAIGAAIGTPCLLGVCTLKDLELK